MNCYKCATPLPDNSKFCLACGADVSGEGHTHEHTGITPPDPELLAALQAELGNDYVVERELGRGGMAIVYLGHDKHLGRKVAIKLLPPMLTFGSGPGFIDRFKREARTAATLDHPHIIPVYRVSTGGKLFWYVMKYLQGESLDVILKREGQFDVDRTVEILSQAADALDHAHQNKVVHRDVKPANIMLDARGRVTVTDFGIAKALETTALTNSGATIGTPHYMAPEQCSGLPVTGAADQYALAVTAYQMLSGHLPFQADSVLELMRMHTSDPPPPLGTLRPSLSSELVAAVERGLAKDPAERFATCTDFARELGSAAVKMDAAARRPTAGVGKQTAEEIRLNTPRGRTPPRSGAASDSGASALTEAPPMRRRTLALVIGGVGIAALVVAAVLIIPKITGSASRGGNAGPAGSTQTTGGQSQTGVAPGQPGGAPAGAFAREDSTRAVTPAVAHVELSGVPRGATILRNGERMAGPSFDAEPGKAIKLEVSAAGFEPWELSVTPTAGEQLTRTVTLRPVRSTASGPPAGGAKQFDAKQRDARQADAKQGALPGAGAVSAPPASAYVTVGSRPTSVITVNGRTAPTNPVSNFEVAPGRVVIRFTVTDSTGVWSMDTVVMLDPGERRNLRFIQLRRP